MSEFVLKSAAVALTVGVVFTGFAEEAILENPAFEQIEADGNAPGWWLGGCFRAVRGEGHNGNGGLVWQAAERQGKLHTARQMLKGVKAAERLPSDTRLAWNAATRSFGDAKADGILTTPYRKGWEVKGL